MTLTPFEAEYIYELATHQFRDVSSGSVSLLTTPEAGRYFGTLQRIIDRTANFHAGDYQFSEEEVALVEDLKANDIWQIKEYLSKRR